MAGTFRILRTMPLSVLLRSVSSHTGNISACPSVIVLSFNYCSDTKNKTAFYISCFSNILQFVLFSFYAFKIDKMEYELLYFLKCKFQKMKWCNKLLHWAVSTIFRPIIILIILVRNVWQFYAFLVDQTILSDTHTGYRNKSLHHE